MEIRSVILGGGSIIDVIGSMLKGVVVGFMVDGMCKTSLGIILKPMMAIFGLHGQVDKIQEALESGNPADIAVSFVELICMLFGLTSQCFTGDTLVSTEYGLVPIEEIEIGDYIWSEDTKTGKKELKQVTDVIVTMTDLLVYVTTQNGEEIHTTENHPFYVEGKGWVAAAELEVGDILHTQGGREETVADVTVDKQEEPVKVYNLTIEDYHTYYVSADSVLVHNVCGEELSENEIKDAMKAAPLKPTQKSVSIPMIQRYLNRILNGERDVPPILVDGNLVVDGHHRYIASILAGIEVDIRNWTTRDSIDIYMSGQTYFMI